MRKISLILIVIGLALSIVAPLEAEDNIVNWQVRSEYTNPLPGSSKTVVIWDFKMHKLQNGKSVITVFDNEHRLETAAELLVDAGGGLRQVKCSRLVSGKKVNVVVDCDPLKPALINQTIIPVDWLQISGDGNLSNKFVLREKIGGKTFSYHLQIKEKKISFSEAEAEGMLTKDDFYLAGAPELRLLTVERDFGDYKKEVLRQLVGDSEGFWFFEEKGTRRSWRLSTPSNSEKIVN